MAHHQKIATGCLQALHLCLPACTFSPFRRRTAICKWTAADVAAQSHAAGLLGVCLPRQRCRLPRRARQIKKCHAMAAQDPASRPGPWQSSSLFGGLSWGAGVMVLCAAGWAVVQNAGYSAFLTEWAASSALGKSGFLAAFALIFLSEIGDKTFFIAGLLAMKVGRILSFLGSTIALAIMTVISVVIGYGFKSVPDALKSSIPVGHYLSVACLLYFGVKTLRDAWRMPSTAETAGGGELASAQESLQEAEKGGGLAHQTSMQSLLQVSSIIFLAEWGDRSMLATVALGASHSPLGVAAGAILGHALATLLAVTGAALASKYISERTLGFLSGGFFLAFAFLTVLGVF